MNCYFGKKPDPNKDPFNRRTVKQLNDIDFSEDSEDDFEDVKSLKRQRRLILTEENLRLFLSEETLKINLEHHHWLKPSFISKIGKMAPNLIEVNLRRLKLTNTHFEELVYHFHKVEVLDISECPLIEDKGLLKFFENCGKILKRFEASNCQTAITDESVKALANLENTTLSYLDIGYAKLVTDEGLNAFEGKTFPLTHLNISGLTSASSLGLYHPIYAARKTLKFLNCSLHDQEEAKNPEFSKAIGHCT